MGYKSQPQNEQEVAKSSDDLAVFREQLTILQQKIASAKIEESDLRSSILNLETLKRSANQTLADLEIRKANLSNEINTALDNAFKAKEVELDKKLTLLVIEPSKNLARKCEELDTQAKALREEAAALSVKKDELVLKEAELRDRELILESSVHAADNERAKLVAQINDFEKSKALFDSEVSKLLISKQQVDNREKELSERVKALGVLEAEVSATSEMLKAKLAALDDVAKREEKLAVDLKEFEVAKFAVESKVQELEIFERDLKKRLAEVKQQQQALASQLKGE